MCNVKIIHFGIPNNPKTQPFKAVSICYIRVFVKQESWGSLVGISDSGALPNGSQIIC